MARDRTAASQDAPHAAADHEEEPLAPDRVTEPVVLRRVPGGVPNLDVPADVAAGRRTADQPLSVRLQAYLHPGAGESSKYDHWSGVSWVVAFHGEHPAQQAAAFRVALTQFIEGWVEQAQAAGTEADRG